jgi:hypothetical protein
MLQNPLLNEKMQEPPKKPITNQAMAVLLLSSPFFTAQDGFNKINKKS